MWRAWIILGLALSACTDFPEVDASLAQGDPVGDYPELLPFEALLPEQDARLTESDDDAIRARADALRNRADGLRGPVVEPDTRDRMDDGVARP